MARNMARTHHDDLNRFNELQGLTIPDLLRERARQYPFNLALSAQSFRGHRDRITFAQLEIRMEAVAQGLARRGVRKGDRVALFLSNDAVRECILTAVGCYRLAAIVAPMNVRASDEELGHALGLVQPSHIVTMQSGAERIGRLYPTAQLILLEGKQGEDGTWPEPEREFRQGLLPDVAASEDPSVLLLTSGTTARSKAVTHCHRSQLYTGYAIGGAIGLTDRDTYQGAWPIYTSSVLNLACMAAWVSGAGVVLEGASLNNAERLRLIETEGTTVYHGVTAPLHFMIEEYPNDGYDLRRVRRIGYGGAAMPREIIEKFSKRLPWADQVHIWAMTETGPAGSYLPPWFLPRKAGCIGIAQPGCAVQVVDDHGKPVADGEPGEIAFAGPSAALGYWRDPEATDQTFVDGWIRTGDIGMIDDEGHMHFLDRKKDIINRGGLKIASAAVEDVIYRFPGVAEAAVIAVPHPGLGEDIAACVVAAPGTTLDLDKIRAHCARYLADYETPRKWHVLDALPKNPMGKILKRDLRQQIIERM
ncbi:class I adenylate-forming enzyme family protein [Mesorhizobium sp. NZP2298]|uniref:class I adenylate-forming enzyme family protein n=1 Tax=Mesorhizobium sp. NZP2298 TaxID=2483403 RepID=UPI001557A51B|nr:class I adenylate-forming enzyme family protein [Mesorhizobium sp. NZP2298]QKC98324.1 long-chain fatty acid--CoA ligase [Mesorhizobium sp. NZP2298]